MAKEAKLVLVFGVMVVLCIPLVMFKRFRRRHHRGKEFDDVYGNLSYTLFVEGVIFFAVSMMAV